MGANLSALLPDWLPGNGAVANKKAVLCYVTALLSCYVTYKFWVQPFLSPLRKMPGLGYHPVFGNVREAMTGQAMEASVRWVTKYGNVLRYYGLLGRESVLVADPQAMKHVLVTHAHKYGRVTPSNTPLGRSVLTVTGEEHKALRRLLNPVFSPQVIKGYMGVFSQYTDRLSEYWREQVEQGTSTRLHVQQDLFRTTFDVFGQAVLGCEFNSLREPQSELVQSFMYLLSMDSVSYRSFLPFYKYLPTAANTRRRQCLQVVNATVSRLITDAQTQLQDATGAELKHDLLLRLMAARDDVTGSGLSPQGIHDNVFTLIFAGYETTAMTISWILLLLAEHPEHQARVQEEVHQVCGAGDITWEHLDQLKYLDAVVKEGQRLYPAAATVPRYTVEEDELAGYTVPAGTPVICHFGALMRNPHVWKDPETFSPQRFLDSTDTWGMYAYLPFGSGATKCLGHVFARVQVRLLLATLLTNFRFSLVPGFVTRRKHKITLKAVPPIELLVTRVT